MMMQLLIVISARPPLYELLASERLDLEGYERDVFNAIWSHPSGPLHDQPEGTLTRIVQATKVLWMLRVSTEIAQEVGSKQLARMAVDEHVFDEYWDAEVSTAPDQTLRMIWRYIQHAEQLSDAQRELIHSVVPLPSLPGASSA